MAYIDDNLMALNIIQNNTVFIEIMNDIEPRRIRPQQNPFDGELVYLSNAIMN